jgi:hypothetical protein
MRQHRNQVEFRRLLLADLPDLGEVGEHFLQHGVALFLRIDLGPGAGVDRADIGSPGQCPLLLEHGKSNKVDSIVAWPLENGGPKRDWKPGTDTIADIRRGSLLKRSYEKRQRKPDDLEAQEGRRPIAIHALENLAHSDTGIVMLRRLLREQLQRVEQGLDPINILRDPSANQRVPTGAWNTILSPVEAAVPPYSEDL